MTAIIEPPPRMRNGRRRQSLVPCARTRAIPVECPVPWTTMICRFEDLDDDEQAVWQAEFDADRHSARKARPPGT